MKVEAVDGGLMQTSFADASVTYQAPDTGYHVSDNLGISTTNHWSDMAQQMYFVNSRNGRVYSKVFLTMMINSNPDEPLLLTIRGAANSNSSRNWEASAAMNL